MTQTVARPRTPPPPPAVLAVRFQGLTNRELQALEAYGHGLQEIRHRRATTVFYLRGDLITALSRVHAVMDENRNCATARYDGLAMIRNKIVEKLRYTGYSIVREVPV